MSKHELEGKFNPKDFEDEIYENWEKKGYFKPSNDKSKKPYTIVIPPPNITGRLHMGHALDETLQDILIRYKRMAGYNALWVPGTDHASIATEAKIVAKLKEEGITKEDLGREEFLKRAWDWKKEYGGIITKQIRKLGSSCDWSRERFTLDEGLSNAVQTVFINLYNKGLIYRGERMINWCPTCHTSISDSEVEYEQEPTHLWHIKYPIKGEEGKYLIVATTRPETMLGDTGVAVNPNDERYKAYIGKTVMLPIVGREIPIIAADFVETEFGTGAVKLTPAHDVNDYQAGLDNNLEMIKVFDENGIMNDIVPEFAGLDIYEARKRIVEKLKEIGALIKKIKWRWTFIWFFSANFLGLGKETALTLTTKFPEIFNYISIALYALAILLITLYLIKRWFNEKTPRLKPFQKHSLIKKTFIFGTFIFVVFWLIVLVSVYGSWNVKYNVSQTAIIFLAVTLPFTASAFIETAVKDKKLKPFLIFGALSLLFLALAALLSVPIDSPYDIY